MPFGALLLISLGLYLLATALFFLRSVQHSAQRIAAWFACAFHLAGALAALGTPDAFGIDSIATLNLALAYLVFGYMLSSVRTEVMVIASWLFPLAACASFFGLNSPVSQTHPIALGLLFHIVLSIFAFAMIALALVQALVVQYATSRLKQGVSTTSIQFPPIQTLERMLFGTIRVGTLALTFAILTGLWYLNTFFSTEMAPKSIMTLAAWLLFTVLLIGRYKLGWRGKLVTRLTLLGTTLLVLGFIGTRFLGSLI